MFKLERENKYYIETFTGKKFRPFSPSVNDMDLIDMVHATSLEPRYGGHTKHAWSVAQHLLAIIALLRFRGYSSYMLLLVGSHDFEEAYLKDMPKPVKMFMPEYEAAGIVIRDMIWHEYFGLRKPTEEELRVFEEVDKELLYYEAIALNINKTNWVSYVPPEWDYEFTERPAIEVEMELFKEIENLHIEVMGKTSGL
jgi:hypothetical protein